DMIYLTAIAVGGTGLSHLVSIVVGGVFQSMDATANTILASGFFWIVVTATTLGLGASFTNARSLEGAGASKLGTVFIFLLVTVIGTRMDILAITEQPLLFVMGIIWMLFHTILLFVVAKMIRAPFFFIAVGSKANVGGAASAPVLAAAFHPALAPVGVLLAVLGYALGTYGAILCATLMEIVAPI
ncbi:MAG: DUF819 family protein, partial [Pseudomonadota bacterium]